MTARHFLGWNAAPLGLAADWITHELGPDQGQVVIALPGARAGRLLREALAERLGPSWTPPRFVTAGTLTDALLTLDVPAAGRTARTLAWVRALQELSPQDLDRIIAAPPAEDDLRGWTKLATEVRQLFGELAAEGKNFAQVAELPALQAASGGERARWSSLSRAQSKMEALLAKEDLADPHLARLAAIEAGRVDMETRVLLVGVVELNGLTRRLLDQREADCLIFAPEERAGQFDELGCVLPEQWAEHHTALPLEGWHVVEQPVNQAQQAIECLAGFGQDKYRAEQVTIGVAQASVTPYLRRHLGALGIAARDAAGTPARETAPVRLLSALAEHLARPTFEGFADLLRHDDLERALRRADEALKNVVPARSTDAYSLEHLPYLLDGTWPADSSSRRDVERRDEVAALHRALEELLTPLLGDGRRQVPEWAGRVRDVLEQVYGKRGLDPQADEQQRLTVEGLAAIGKALGELEDRVPPGLAPLTTAAESVELLVDVLSGSVLPPRPVQRGEATVDLLGWLELPLDNAPALVVTGFNEGSVPEAPQANSWLPDSVREELGLEGNTRRMARDLYIVDLLVHSREQVAFVSGRRTVQGDPQLPSRIAYRRPAQEVPSRVTRALPKSAALATGGPADTGEGRPPFVAGIGQEPKTWSASAFGDYLSSPYLFWLQRIAGKYTVDAAARELDALRFGNLAHAVLEDFGGSDLRHSEDPEAIAAFLAERLQTQALERFGRGTYPAVRIQLHQLEHRLRRFAQVQAQRTSQGWRIAHVEWKPSEPVEFAVPGGAPVKLTGSVDRIDRHADGRWAILDYKTGEGGKAPDKVHRKSDNWISVQLPLYSHLAREIIGDAAPQLGFVTLGKDSSSIGFSMADWDPDAVEEALDVARGVVIDVRELLASGEPFPHYDGKVYDPILRAVVGEKLIGVGDDR